MAVTGVMTGGPGLMEEGGVTRHKMVKKRRKRKIEKGGETIFAKYSQEQRGMNF
jgi:hypothetical protein